MKPSWTDERIAILKQKWCEGWSASQVANHLGVTRNAAMGKLSQLGLVGFKPKPESRGPKELKKRSPKPRQVMVVEEKEMVVGGISLYDLTSTTCRWPVGNPDIRFCGATCDAEKPYCDDHAQLATRR